jgi:hypothetical protein
MFTAPVRLVSGLLLAILLLGIGIWSVSTPAQTQVATVGGAGEEPANLPLESAPMQCGIDCNAEATAALNRCPGYINAATRGDPSACRLQVAAQAQSCLAQCGLKIPLQHIRSDRATEQPRVGADLRPLRPLRRGEEP